MVIEDYKDSQQVFWPFTMILPVQEKREVPYCTDKIIST